MANKATSQLDKLSNNNLFIVLGLITLLALGITGLLGKSLIGHVILNGKVISKQSTAKSNLKTDLDAAPKLITAYKALGSEASTIADGLPNEPDFAGLLVIFQNLAGTSGVTVQSLAPTTGTSDDTASTGDDTSTESVNAPAPQELDFSASVSGSYANITKFLTNVETSARPLRITSAQFSGSGSSLTVTLSIATYYQAKGTLPFGKETVK